MNWQITAASVVWAFSCWIAYEAGVVHGKNEANAKWFATTTKLLMDAKHEK